MTNEVIGKLEYGFSCGLSDREACLFAGINPDTVRRVVGHRDIQTTLNNYYFDRSSAEERAKQFAEAFDKQPIFEALESSDSKMEMSDSKSA